MPSTEPIPIGRGESFPRSSARRALEAGLLSRTQFLDNLGRQLKRTRQSLAPTYVVLCADIDRFKVVSASLGREMGDLLLDSIAVRIRALLTKQDAFARIGGDEFAILFEETGETGTAASLADAIQRVLISGFEIEGATMYATASIGVARVLPSYDGAEDVLRDAEIAMYHAKARGRARSEVFQPVMYHRAIDLFELERDLRRAVERNEFELYYQPIVSVATGRVRAFESLLRWRHPERGMQSPSHFLPLLKETGLIVPVGEWVVMEACRQAKEWETARGRPIPVTINLAPQQFTHTSVISIVAHAIETTGVDPRAVMLEITEDALVEDLESARETLLPLRERGVRTMIDDFGTGYSSLSYLRRLPIDAIKIDASFIDRIERFTEDRMIVRAIVALAHALELCVVAEGIERREQLVELVGLDCEEAQGYLISPPVNAAVATEMVVTRWSRAIELDMA